MHASADTLATPNAQRPSRGASGALDARAMRSIWERQQVLLESRLATIGRATGALADCSLDESTRDRAQRAAHMLAGSIGMFGFHGAARAARELERGLARPTHESVQELAALLDLIRSDIGVQPPGVSESSTRARPVTTCLEDTERALLSIPTANVNSGTVRARGASQARAAAGIEDGAK